MHIRTKNNSVKSFFDNFLKLFFAIAITFLVLGFIFSLGKRTSPTPPKEGHTRISPSPLERVGVRSDFLLTSTGQKIFIQLATSSLQRQQGLSGKEKLKSSPAEGMFFVFEENKVLTFWMKDMNFDLDIIWLTDNLDDKSYKIVYIEKNVSKNSYNKINPNLSKTFSNPNDPPHLAKYVLEINAGLSEKMNLKVGDIMLK